ncbi:MAG: hypothetical protein ACTHMF_04535 [Leifsonia sp.]|uniref:hypothetical protein n=1 Tax=Leifsonia sp. TaxID=1870902 RepID=UPI003F7DA180
MVTTDAPALASRRRHRVGHVLGAVMLGVVAGLGGSYLVALAATARLPGDFSVDPLVLVMLAGVAALGVAGGRRWPVAGLTAGILILVLVAFAVVCRLAWSSSDSAWLDPFNAIAFGAASGYPAMLGAVLATSSALGLQRRRAALREGAHA